jgi:glycosyltransferase involved in cell wall biosynthesis
VSVLKRVLKLFFSRLGFQISRLPPRYEAAPAPAPAPFGQLHASVRFPDVREIERSGRALSGLEKLSIHWIIPGFRVGAGGHMTIFRIAHFLEKRGHRNTFWINDRDFFESESQIGLCVNEHFQKFEQSEFKFLDDKPSQIEGDICFATDRWTVFPLKHVTKVRGRMYFVQDYEPDFYPVGSSSFLTKHTYEAGFPCVTAGPYLEKLMTDKFGLWARSFNLAVDHNVYFQRDVLRETNSIYFYSRIETPRRCVELGLLALEELARKRNLDIYLFGSEIQQFPVSFPHTNLGICSEQKLAEIYSKGSLGLVLSGTNYSLIPQEMMACGMPVVELDTECNRLVYPKGSITLAQPVPDKIAEAVESILDNRVDKYVQSDLALRYVQSLNWRDQAIRVESAIFELLRSS